MKRTLNEKGYVRLWKRGPLYGKYEHRVILAQLCREFCYYPLQADGLPADFTVEHLDHCKTHNCHQNLILLDPRIHNSISSRTHHKRQELEGNWKALHGLGVFV